jgi:hypothetical protein
MSFFSRKKEPAQENARDKAIREFRQAFPNIRKPYNDDSAFEVLFQVDQLWYTLKIFLTGDFPVSKPSKQSAWVILSLEDYIADRSVCFSSCSSGWRDQSSMARWLQASCWL